MTNKQPHNPYSSLPKLSPANAYTTADVFIRGVPIHHSINIQTMKVQDNAGYSGSNKQNNNLETKSKAKPSIAHVPFPLGYQRIQEEENLIRFSSSCIL